MAARHHRRQVFARTDHHPRDADLAGALEGFAQQHVTLLRLLARHQHIGLFVVLDADRILADEGLDLDRLTSLRGGRLDVLRLQHDIAALLILKRLDDFLPRHFLAGFRIHAFVAHRRVAAAVQHAEMQIDTALARHQRHRNIEQAERECSGPDGTCHGRHSPGSGRSIRRRTPRGSSPRRDRYPAGRGYADYFPARVETLSNAP